MTDRPHLTFVHGQPGGAADWDLVLERLPEADHLAYDRPGYRANPAAPTGLDGNADALLALLDERGVRRTVLVGHSYGAGVAALAAARAPERVAGLVSVAGIGPGCLDGWDTLLAAPVTGEVCALVAWTLTPWAGRARLALLRRRHGGTLPPGRYVNWETWADARHERGSMRRTFLVEQRDLMRSLPALDAQLGDVQAPTVILHDPKDALVPVATAHALHAAISGSRLQLVGPGPGHSLHRRAPDVVVAAIRELLAGL